MSAMLYLDNAATTWPKPEAVTEAVFRFMRDGGSSPGRSGHRLSVAASREVFETRALAAQFFGLPSSERVVFTANATHAINIAIKGVLQRGDHVICTGMEHNSVIRPLRRLEQEGIITLDVLKCNHQGKLDPETLRAAIRPDTRLVAAIHASNVNGALMPVDEIGRICREHKVLFLLDAAQSAGLIPLDMQAQHIDMLAMSGHKKLYGLQGTGILCLAEGAEPRSLTEGGSGSRSEHELHPEFLPDRLEAGTPNTPGIIALKAGLQFIMQEGREKLLARQQALLSIFLGELRQDDRIRIYHDPHGLPLLSLTVAGITPSDLAQRLDETCGVLTRPGLHCAPLAHHSLGTFPQGSLRISPGIFNTEEEMQHAAHSILEIINE